MDQSEASEEVITCKVKACKFPPFKIAGLGKKTAVVRHAIGMNMHTVILVKKEKNVEEQGS